MAAIGTRIEEQGLLILEDGQYQLRRDVGGRWKLEVRVVGADHVGKRVTIVGTVVEDGLIDVSSLAAA